MSIRNLIYSNIFSFVENGDQSPHSSSKSIGKTDSPIPIIRETSPKLNQNESNREYKHVTDFTGPTVTHTSKVKKPIHDHVFYYSIITHQ